MAKLKMIPVLMVLVLASGCSRDQMAGNALAAEPDANPDNAAKPGLLSRIVGPSTLTVPEGTPIAVRLQSGVSSASAESGQRFDAVLEEPLVVNGKTVAKPGTPVEGRVVVAHHSGRLHHPGYLQLTLASMVVGGKTVPIATSSVSAKGGSHKKRNWAWIGGSTGGGALIGALAAGGKGALIGAPIGAAGGTVAAFATGKKDVGFGAERRLTFRLARPLEVKV
jgi:hypothetical protein